MKATMIQRLARPAEVLMALALCVYLTAVAQYDLFVPLIVTAAQRTLEHAKSLGPEPNEADKTLLEISHAVKEFLPDGRVLLVKADREHENLRYMKTLQIA